MLRFSRILYSLTIAVIVTSLPYTEEAQARPFGWAKRLPITHYSAQDIELVKQTMAEVLNSGQDGEEASWNNPENGHSGTITPLSSTQQNGKLCRQTRFSSSTQEADNVSEFFLCKQPDGIWAVEQPADQ